jgi:benzil reductase ((S)-benzoin forming)
MKSLYIVTGSHTGLGKSLVTNLLKDNNNLVIGISRHNDIVHPQFQFISLDLSDVESVKQFSFPNIQDFKNVVLINNAGIIGEITSLEKVSIENIESIMTVNYMAVMILASLFIKTYQEAKVQKTIITISSGAATSPYPSWANYCASKAAIEMLMKCIVEEQKNKEFPISAFAIAPGVVDTGMQQQIRNTDISEFEFKPKFLALYEEGKLYKPDDVADKIIEVSQNPFDFNDTIFRIVI